MVYPRGMPQHAAGGRQALLCTGRHYCARRQAEAGSSTTSCRATSSVEGGGRQARHTHTQHTSHRQVEGQGFRAQTTARRRMQAAIRGIERAATAISLALQAEMMAMAWWEWTGRLTTECVQKPQAAAREHMHGRALREPCCRRSSAAPGLGLADRGRESRPAGRPPRAEPLSRHYLCSRPW